MLVCVLTGPHPPALWWGLLRACALDGCRCHHVQVLPAGSGLLCACFARTWGVQAWRLQVQDPPGPGRLPHWASRARGGEMWQCQPSPCPCPAPFQRENCCHVTPLVPVPFFFCANAWQAFTILKNIRPLVLSCSSSRSSVPMPAEPQRALSHSPVPNPHVRALNE